MVEQSMLASNTSSKVKISAAEFSAKFRSKKECYFFLTVTVKAYLPGYETVTIYFLKDLMSGAKKCKAISIVDSDSLDIKCDNFRHIYCP